jgi:uncharacterized membrane protein YbaN (DUF454 family)
MKNFFWKVLGFLSLGMAYIGVVTPGIPWTIFVVGAAYCFAKGSPKMHAWIYNHKTFGPFLTNWTTKKVFPLKAKYLMILTMASSLVIMALTVPIKGVLYSGALMFLVAVWAWRYPSTVEEFNRRKDAGEKIGWFK